MFQTKLNLSNNKFEQTSGSTLNLNGSLSVNSFSATTFFITETPEQGASGDTILVRSTDGTIKQVSQSGLTGSGGGTTLSFNNGLIQTGDIVSLGGTLTGSTTIETNSYGFAIGYNVTVASSSSVGFGKNNNISGYASASIGENNCTYGTQSLAMGYNTCAYGAQSVSSGSGAGSSRKILAGGRVSFNHSLNTYSQVIGHGALACSSVILGGFDHNIESGNLRAAIIGGNAIKLTGTTYIDTTVVPQLAIYSGLTAGTTGDTVLVRDGSTGKIKGVTQSSLGGSGGGTALSFNNGISENNGIVSLGGTLTGNTVVDIGNYGISFGGINSCATGGFSFSAGLQARATGYASTAFGGYTLASGSYSLAIGYGVRGGGTRLIASGLSSKNISNVDFQQGTGHGALAYASSIFGGRNHNIESTNTRATIIGGDSIKLTGTTYIDATALSKLAIMSIPDTGTTGDTILVRDGSTGMVKGISQSAITTSLSFENGLQEINGVVTLGGTQTSDINIFSGGYFGYSFGIGYNVNAFGRNSIAFGSETYAAGTNTMSIGKYTKSCLDGSFSGGYGFNGGGLQDRRPVTAIGTASFNFSINDVNQESAFGAGGCASAILGGLNHNVNIGSTNSIVLGGNTNRINGNNENTAIIGGRNITLTGSGYTDTAVVGNFAIFSGLTAGTTGDTVLVRDGSTGIIKGVSQTSLGGSGGGTALSFNNGLTEQAGIVSLGGTLTGDTRIITYNHGFLIGYGQSIGQSSISLGGGYAYGNNSLAGAGGGIARGLCSIALGATTACGTASVALGRSGTAFANDSFAFGPVSACGINSIALGGCASTVNSESSAIITSRFSTISSGNTGSAIIGGRNIILTGSTYIDTTVVGNLAIFSGLTAGTSGDTVLVRDSSTGIIKGVSQSSLGGSGGGTTINSNDTEIIFNNGGVISGNTTLRYDEPSRTLLIGGTYAANVSTGGSYGNIMVGDGLTGNTSFTLNVGFASIIGGSASASIGTNNTTNSYNSLNVGYCNTLSLGGTNNFITGRQNIGNGFNNIISGYLNNVSTSNSSIIGGRGNTNSGNYNLLVGLNSNNTAQNSILVGSSLTNCGALSFIGGQSITNFGSASIGFGNNITNCGARSFTLGNLINNNSSDSFVFGNGSIGGSGRQLCNSGTKAFMLTNNISGITIGSGNKAQYSAIFGGLNQNIESGNTNTVLIGGRGISLSGVSYIDTTVVGNLAIFSGLTAGTTGDTVLVRDGSTGIIKGVSQTSLGGSGGGTALSFNNGLTEQSGIVSLGGTLTGDTVIDLNNSSILIGNTNYSIGTSAFAVGRNVKPIGNNSITIGYGARGNGTNSVAIGYYAYACQNDSVALGTSTANGVSAFSANKGQAYGDGSTSFGIFARTCGRYSFAGGFGYGANQRHILAVGDSSFNFSRTTINQAQSFTHGAFADNSAILGGQDHNIESGNTNAAIIGGNTIKLTGTSYIDTTAVSKFAIISNPDSGISTDAILVRDNTTGIIKSIPQSGITGGGGTTELNILDITGTTSATLTVNNHVIIVNTASASQTITLPSAPQNGLNFKIKDNGNALTNEITISGNGKNIDGQTTASINTNYGALELIYQQSVDAWYILSFNN